MPILRDVARHIRKDLLPRHLHSIEGQQFPIPQKSPTHPTLQARSSRAAGGIGGATAMGHISTRGQHRPERAPAAAGDTRLHRASGKQQWCAVGLVVPTVTNSWLQCKTAATARESRPNPSALRGRCFAPVARSSQPVRGSLLSDPRRSVLGTLVLCKVSLALTEGAN